MSGFDKGFGYIYEQVQPEVERSPSDRKKRHLLLSLKYDEGVWNIDGFSLPQDADPDRISAEFKDGVLSISIAKQPGSKPKQISVKG